MFTGLARQTSNCTSCRFEMLSYEVIGGDMAYTGSRLSALLS